MNTKISLEIIALIKFFFTVLTLVRFITSVYTKMNLEAAILAGCFFTVLGLVWFVASVYTKMSLKITILIKSFYTELTLVRFITTMYTKMFSEITIPTKSFSTGMDIRKLYYHYVYEDVFKHVYEDESSMMTDKKISFHECGLVIDTIHKSFLDIFDK